MKYIYPYKTASKSARALATAMNAPLLGYDINLVRGGQDKTVINWGSGELPETVRSCKVINKEAAIRVAVNKLATFRALQQAGVRTPEWSQSSSMADTWLKQGHKVVARVELEGRDGSGLALLDGKAKTDWFGRPLPVPVAPLYTKFIQARSEYRINVCNNQTMGVQLKVPTTNNANPDIKTGGNGYAFRLLNDNEIPTGIRPVARAAITALGLDFGGVDLIVGLDGTAYVLEVNTAPELTPAMVTAYSNMLRTM